MLNATFAGKFILDLMPLHRDVASPQDLKV